jgi:twitching motility protein PilJ
MSSKVVKSKISTNAASQKVFALKRYVTDYIDRTAGAFGDVGRVRPLLFLAFASVLLVVFSLAYLIYTVPKSNQMIHDVGDLRVLSEQIAKNASEASTGRGGQAFERLAESQSKFSDRLDSLVSNYGATRDEMATVLKAWGNTNQAVTDMLSNKEVVNDVHDVGVQIRDAVPLVQDSYNKISDRMVKTNASAAQVAFVRDQVLLSERILKAITVVLSGDDTAISSASGFSDDTQKFGKVLNGQLKGDSSLGVAKIENPVERKSLEEVSKIYNDVLKPSAAKMFISSPQITQVRDTAKQLYLTSVALQGQLGVLSTAVQTKYRSVYPGGLMILGLIGLGYALIRMFSMRSRIDQERAMAEAHKEAERARVIQAESVG